MSKELTNGGLFIGLLSGTSIDGIDSALIRLSAEGSIVETLATTTTPISPSMAKEIRAIGAKSSLDKICEIDHYLADAFAAAANKMLVQAPNTETVAAIGCHGQTVWHNGQSFPPVSVQLGDANRIVAQTGTQVVTDFRRRDIAEGGQGAPLAPAFHAHCLNRAEEYQAILNLGGIANLTLLPPKTAKETPSGFDTGPANTLLDSWSREILHKDYDYCGRWAATGQVNSDLLACLLADKYFSQPPPKSTGPEYFSLDWLRQNLNWELAPEDVQATLVELTAASVAKSLKNWGGGGIERILVCGGGTHNHLLLERLQEICRPRPVQTTAAIGVDPDYVEAMAFAWLAWARLNCLPGNLPAVTGARCPAVLGGLYVG